MSKRRASSGEPAPLDLPGLTVASRLPAAGAPRRAGGRGPDGAAPGSPARREPGVSRVGADVDEGVRKALAYVLRSANARPQTEAELRGKLREREVEEGVADEAIAHAKRLGAVDDAALAHALVAERGLRRGFGRARLREELGRRQVPEHLVEDALATLEDRDDLAAATELARERLRQLPEGLPAETIARRLASYLGRRGHPPGLAQRVAVEVSGLRDRWD